MSYVPPPVAPPPPTGPLGSGAPVPKKTNGLAMASLITGIVGFCIPFLGGIAAIILGILGVKKSREQGGKGLAIAGIVLGVISLVVPIIFFGSIFGLVAAGTAPGRAVANEWMTAASAGDIEKAVSLSHPEFPREDIQKVADHVQQFGAFQDMTSNNIDLKNNVLLLEGTATFANGKRRYTIAVTDLGGGDWKLKSIDLE